MSQAHTDRLQRESNQKIGVNNEPAFEIMDLFYALFRWRWFIIFFTIISAILSFLATSARDLEYQAVVSILINPLGINVIEGDINTRTESPDVNIALIESQMRIMESRPVIRQTIMNLRDPNWEGSDAVVDLLEDPELNGKGQRGLKSKLLDLIGVSEKENDKDTILSVISTMRGQIAVYRPQLGYVVELNYQSDNGRKSAIIANAIAQTYLELESASNANQAEDAAKALDDQLNKLREDLNTAETAVEDHKRDKGIVSAAGGLANELEFTQVQQDLIEARNKAAAAKITLESVNALKESGTLPQNLPEAIRSSSIANLRTQLSQAKQRQITLSAQYLPTHPIMRAAELAVEDAQNSVQTEIALIAEAAQLEYNNALRGQNELTQAVSELTNDSFRTNDDLIELRNLQRDAEVKKTLYESFLLRAGELGQQAQVETDEAKIVSPASPPQDPIDLPGVILMAGGTIFGFIMACAIVLIGTGVATLSRSVSDYDDRQSTRRASTTSPKVVDRNKSRASKQDKVKNTKTTRSLLSNIFSPADDLEDDRKRSDKSKRNKGTSEKLGKSKKKKPNRSLNLPVLHSLEIDRGYMIAQTIPFLDEDAAGDKISALVEEILSFSAGTRTRIVMVTGIQDAHGKSTLAANFALAAYQLGHESLLIGMDSENKDALYDFANIVSHEMSTASNSKVAGGNNSVQFSDGGFNHFGIKHMDKENTFQANVELMKLKEHLANNTKRYDIAFIDGPMLDDNNQLENVSELVDEVIISMPKKATGKVKSGIFARLGSRSKRIRGLITTQYYTG